VPLFRVLAGFAWAPHRADEDGDGIDDTLDACPVEAEDVDGWHDEDGCPEPDNDDDGLADHDDTCPDEAEDRDGDNDTDGCPDLDSDGDGIHDGYDSCPQQAEDMDGDRDEDGCPDNDRDRDNIDDDHDQCADQPEDTDGYGDEDGCPETDFDNDGNPDDGDQCPDQAEDVDNFEDDDGCPEEGAALHGRPGDADGDGVRDTHDGCLGPQEDMDGYQDGDGCPDPDNDGDGVLDGEDQCPIESGPGEEHGCPVRVRLELERGTIMLLGQVEFAPNRDRILGRSEPILQQLLRVFQEHPEIVRARIEGHTDDQGADSANLRLSTRRAASVMRWLTRHGVAADRLEAWGCGELHPIGPNDTDDGRQANRRVSFTILEPAIAGLEVPTDCTRAR
jgi:outer membrane protein OmpA-like peptidoglycan-associated protein